MGAAIYGLGTVINVIAIIVGGAAGMLFGKFVTERVQESLMAASGVAVMFIGIGGALQHMLAVQDGGLTTQGTMMMIGSLCIGILIGELLNIEHHLETFGEWLKEKTGNAKDGGFVSGFVTASLTVCVGAMAVVGSIQDGIYGNYSILVTKAVLDLIIVMVMAASMGKGCIFSCVSVGLFQGVMTALSRLIAPVLTDAALANLDYVGSIMIFCVGVNLFFGKRIRVANMLPGLVVAVVWALF